MKGTVKIGSKRFPPNGITHGPQCCKKGINDRQAQWIYRDYQPLQYKDPHEKKQFNGGHKGFCCHCSLDGFNSKNVFLFTRIWWSPYWTVRPGSPASDVRFSIRAELLSQKTVSWADTTGGFLFASDFFWCFFFAIWNPDFWSELRWPTVRFLVALSQNVFPKEIFQLLFILKACWVCAQFSEKKRVENFRESQ